MDDADIKAAISTRVYKEYLHVEAIKGKGLASILIDIQAGPLNNERGSNHFHTVAIYSYSDCTRDVSLLATKDDAQDRAWELYHLAHNKMLWNERKLLDTGIHALSSVKAAEPIPRFDKEMELWYIYSTYTMEVLYDLYK
jgi:hypothetical protein